MSGSATVGWCPGALRPMESGDGLLLRVKPRCGRLTLAQAEAVALLAMRFGNGHLDLTGRANLQIRGARPDTLEPLWAGLRKAGLLDGNAAAEAVRNIVVSPLAGIDRGAFDIRPFVTTLEECLTVATDRHGDEAAGKRNDAQAPSSPLLPPKWSFIVDGGGRLPLEDVAADMRFHFDLTGRLRIGLDTAWSDWLAAPIDLPTLLARTAVLVAATPQPMRMKALLARVGGAAAFAALGLPPATQGGSHPAPMATAALFAATDGVIGFSSPFGALPAATLLAVVAACRDAGGADLRLTPWRVLLATGITDRGAVTKRLDRLDLITHADDPRLAVSACVGAPACHRATTSTRADAALLAVRLGRDGGGIVHVAGCRKGCARPPSVPWALVAREGRYDLFRDGDTTPRVTGLSSTEAANWLSRAERARAM